MCVLLGSCSLGRLDLDGVGREGPPWLPLRGLLGPSDPPYHVPKLLVFLFDFHKKITSYEGKGRMLMSIWQSGI